MTISSDHTATGAVADTAEELKLNITKNAGVAITVSDYGSDTDGVTLGKADGMLFLRDDGTDIGINDGWIEGSSDWGDGSFKSVAIAVSNLNDNGTSNSNDDSKNNFLYGSIQLDKCLINSPHVPDSEYYSHEN